MLNAVLLANLGNEEVRGIPADGASRQVPPRRLQLVFHRMRKKIFLKNFRQCCRGNFFSDGRCHEAGIFRRVDPTMIQSRNCPRATTRHNHCWRNASVVRETIRHFIDLERDASWRSARECPNICQHCSVSVSYWYTVQVSVTFSSSGAVANSQGQANEGRAWLSRHYRRLAGRSCTP